MPIRTFLALSLFLALSISSVSAAPAAAYNKTITISFSSSGTRTDSMGKSAGYNSLVTRVIYVSSEGRLFMRHTVTSMKGSGRVARGRDAEPGSGRGGSFTFQGNRLVGTILMTAGAMQITASFDPGFTSCTASVIEGRTAGGSIRRRAPSGEMVEITSVSNSTPSCSIQSGNTFAR